jgi:hypothetical protein
MAQDPTAAPAPASPTVAPSTGKGIGNASDVQGIIGLVFVSGTLAIAGVAIYLGASATTVLASVLPLTGTIIGY